MTSNTFARRAKLSTAAIALAIAVTIAAVAAVLYSGGSSSRVENQAASAYQLQRPVSENQASTP